MTISYPISAPSSPAPRRLRFGDQSVIGVGESPFSLEQQVQDMGGERWTLEVELPPLDVTGRGVWVGGVLLALRGRYGTLLLGPVNAAARYQQGTWYGQSPLVNGASQTGKTLAIDGLTAGSTGLAGDWFQLGTGSTTRLHQLTAAFTANGSGEATLDFWPALRSSPANNAAVVLAAPKGLWRRASSANSWDEDLAATFGLSFSLVEAL